MKRDVAIVVLVNEKNEMFLVRTNAYPDAWQPIGGGIDEEDDGPEAAAIREAHEEVGIVLDHLEQVTVVPFDFGEGSVHCFYVRVSSTVVLNVDRDEILESGWFSIDDARALPAYPATKACIRECESRLSKSM